MSLFLPRQLVRAPIWRAELLPNSPIVSYFDAAWSFAEQEPRELVSNTTTAWIQRDSRIVRTPFGIGATVPTGNFAYRTVSLDTRFPYVVFVIGYKQNAELGQEDLYSLGDNNSSGAFLRMFMDGSPVRFSASYRSQNGVATMSVAGPPVLPGLVAMALHIPDGTATNARLFVNGVSYTGTGTNQSNTNVTFDHESVGGLRTNADFGQSRNNTTLFAARGRRSTVDQEALRQWTINPFAIFRPANSPVFYSLPSAGGVDGSVDRTLDAATLSASATVAAGPSATLTATLDAATLSSSATVAAGASGTLTATLGALTVAADATVGSSPTAQVTATLDALTASSSATVAAGPTATVAATLGAATVTSSATVATPVTGTVTSTLGSLTLVSSATVAAGITGATASVDAQLGGLVVASAAAVAGPDAALPEQLRRIGGLRLVAPADNGTLRAARRIGGATLRRAA